MAIERLGLSYINRGLMPENKEGRTLAEKDKPTVTNADVKARWDRSINATLQQERNTHKLLVSPNGKGEGAVAIYWPPSTTSPTFYDPSNGKAIEEKNLETISLENKGVSSPRKEDIDAEKDSLVSKLGKQQKKSQLISNQLSNYTPEMADRRAQIIETSLIPGLIVKIETLKTERDKHNPDSDEYSNAQGKISGLEIDLAKEKKMVNAELTKMYGRTEDKKSPNPDRVKARDENNEEKLKALYKEFKAETDSDKKESIRAQISSIRKTIHLNTKNSESTNQAESQKHTQEINNLQTEITSLKAELSTKTTDLATLNDAIVNLQKNPSTDNTSEIAALQAQLATKTAELNALAAKVDALENAPTPTPVDTDALKTEVKAELQAEIDALKQLKPKTFAFAIGLKDKETEGIKFSEYKNTDGNFDVDRFFTAVKGLDETKQKKVFDELRTNGQTDIAEHLFDANGKLKEAIPKPESPGGGLTVDTDALKTEVKAELQAEIDALKQLKPKTFAFAIGLKDKETEGIKFSEYKNTDGNFDVDRFFTAVKGLDETKQKKVFDELRTNSQTDIAEHLFDANGKLKEAIPKPESPGGGLTKDDVKELIKEAKGHLWGIVSPTGGLALLAIGGAVIAYLASKKDEESKKKLEATLMAAFKQIGYSEEETRRAIGVIGQRLNVQREIMSNLSYSDTQELHSDDEPTAPPMEEPADADLKKDQALLEKIKAKKAKQALVEKEAPASPPITPPVSGNGLTPTNPAPAPAASPVSGGLTNPNQQSVTLTVDQLIALANAKGFAGVPTGGISSQVPSAGPSGPNSPIVWNVK